MSRVVEKQRCGEGSHRCEVERAKYGFPWLDNSFPSLENDHLWGSVSTIITLTAVSSTRNRVRLKG